MAANKFATILHRNTNKLSLILIYAVLEWILIILLLLNSLFSYLLIKYAEYFGLKRPCLWCSRLDHLFDSSKAKNYYTDLVCDDHATEISKLGYCSIHRKLAESPDMCEDCSSSSQPELSKNFAFFHWMRQIGMTQGRGELMRENGEVKLKCSCCDVSLESKLYSKYYLVKPSWEVLDCTLKGSMIEERDVDHKTDEGIVSDQSRSGFVSDHHEDEQRIEENREIEIVSEVEGGCEDRELGAEDNWSSFVPNVDLKEMVANEDCNIVDAVTEKEQEQETIKEDDLKVSMDDPSCDQAIGRVSSVKDKSVDILPQHLEFYIDGDDCHLIPIEFKDSATEEMNKGKRYEKEDEGNCGDQDFVLDFGEHVGTSVELVVGNRFSSSERRALITIEEEPEIELLESREFNENENFLVLQAEDVVVIEEIHEKVAITQATQTSPTDNKVALASAATAEQELNLHAYQDTEVPQLQCDEIIAEISVGTEIPAQELIDGIQPQECIPSNECIQEDPSTSCSNLHVDDDHGSRQLKGEFVEFNSMTVETSELVTNNHLSWYSGLNESEEDKVPYTPTSIDGLQHTHKKLVLLEKKESGTEESLDGSVCSDTEPCDGVLTVEKLKSALRAERKALNDLYVELEEERSASAVSANQTMAMINRLQEEKAAVQMEALQYQRMMEEQSEYDQEALHLLNELIVKREREKAELEKELEIYRKKVQEYEKMLLSRRKDSGTSSASWSNAEDSDGLSVDLNQDAKEVDSFDNHQESSHQNTPVDEVLYLEESLANFEDERISILEQLKILEEKLSMLSEEEEWHFEDVEPIEHFYEEKGNGCNGDFEYSSEVNGVANGHYKGMNGKRHQDMKIMGSKANRLLPFFDATNAETEDGILSHGNAQVFDSDSLKNSSITKFALENKKDAIEEEVDHVYERLQALEADREFLKHSISSLKKGDKGIHLLKEILQHLRDLRSVELRVRSMGDGSA
ncbi:Zein-binding domain-containing protein [Cephalotus follicularis]|uniref:Zein-binding domain-containing protein n=1 Tax=Cephalotus follicularis TaxID=3775 RepID=A0A1Q3B631_CEPFO|nr:Zein-binding domain-containing protein [Cephalotus follicularis]